MLVCGISEDIGNQNPINITISSREDDPAIMARIDTLWSFIRRVAALNHVPVTIEEKDS